MRSLLGRTQWRAGLVSAAVLAVGLLAAPVALGDQVTITSSPAKDTNQTTAKFGFSSPAGATAGYRCNLDGAGSGTFTQCTSPMTFTSLSEGQHIFSVKHARDDTTPAATYTWTVDLTPPTSFLQTRPDSLTNSPTATFTFGSTDPTPPNYLCSLNGAAFAACVSPVTYSGLGDGTRSFSEEAIDQAGNVQLGPPNSYTWTTDVTPPDTTIIDGPPSSTNQTYAQFEFSGSDTTSPGDYFECSLDGAPFDASGCGSFGPLKAGTHTLAVRAVDEVGNVDPTPALYTWTIDLTPPKPPILHLGLATETSPKWIDTPTVAVSWQAVGRIPSRCTSTPRNTTMTSISYPVVRGTSWWDPD
jgi:hypothetical protein